MTPRKFVLSTTLSSLVALGAAEAHAAPPKAPPTTDTSERPRAFFGVLVTGALVHEDAGNRLTTRRRSAFATPGLALRAGAVVGRHHLIGGLFQGSWRSTRGLRDRSAGEREWGAISTWTIGPEYRYLTSFGLYAGGSLGFAFTFADDDVGGGGSPDCSTWRCLDEHLRDTDDRGIPGVAARGVVGYEYRVRRNLAVSTEAFVGVVHGDDEHNRAMTLPTWGIGVGVGF